MSDLRWSVPVAPDRGPGGPEPAGWPRRGGRHRPVPAASAGPSRWELAREAVLDRLPLSWREARYGPRRSAVLGAAAIVVVVAVILGVRLSLASAAARPVLVGRAQSTHASRPTAPISSVSSAAGSAPGAATGSALTSGPSSGATPVASSATGSLVVYVSGRVRHVGVVTLAAGSRVQDALRAAGGALPGSDLESINLAQPLSDGEQVNIARRGGGSLVSSGGSGGGVGVGGAAGGTLPGGPVVDLNTADATALDALPGVGPVLAQRIVDWRTAHGRFSSVDELDEVSGIGDKLLSEIRPHVRV